MAYEVRGLRKSYGDKEVLGGLDLSFPEGRITVVLGPSGCGKTTMLNILASLDTDFEGEIVGFGRDEASYVFQEDRLLPWMGAADNVAFVLRRLMEASDARRVAEEALSAVGLASSVDARPGAMSGGMRRRVALARAFAYPSEVMLLDEPFSSLDLKTRISVMDLFLDLRAEDGRSAVVVTHDVREALYLGDRIATLSDRPARARDSFDLELDRAARSYASGSAAEIEARLYASILS
ncbi:MAG: ABC transporter ATP-binding protein [Spirochaetes bacterium]|nr:ABC transporter ATP-binding protein [Spirochaetota bacterium]MBU1080745.1 ABC transporter ATP-binding protein [Spirochaetota bacterium]